MSFWAGRRVLVVEDDFFIAEDLRRTLCAEGAEVIGPVATIDNALDLLAQKPALDGAVIDINLRGKPAFPIADILAARGIPFAFATGYDRIDVPSRYAGIPLCEKPTVAAKLAHAIFG